MPDSIPRALLETAYFRSAQEYLSKLRPEQVMEAVPQARQREITVESFALVAVHRPDIQTFNELLVQYPLPRRKKPGQVVPDNMVVVHDQPIQAEGSFDLPLQPVGPFLMLEYVSQSSKRKDYVENMRKYEQELKVPYYLLFTSDAQELILYHRSGDHYVSVAPNEQGRHPIPELELEVAILDGWVRYWFRGQLLPLPADLQRALDQAHRQVAEAEQRAVAAERQADLARQAQQEMVRELDRLRALLAQQGQGPEASGSSSSDPST